MGQRTKETPTKNCEWCGAPFIRKRVGKDAQLECVSNFMRRKFCSISCSAARQHATEPPTVAASRKRAMKRVEGSCESCGQDRELVVHHVDCDPMNNASSNLQTLCTYCHSFWHAMHRRIGIQPQARMPPMVELADCAPTATRSRRNARQSSSKQ
jgi:hypothetical protein